MLEKAVGEKLASRAGRRGPADGVRGRRASAASAACRASPGQLVSAASPAAR